ncbi:MAG: PEP-CTERM sorting domain-containing protein [Planctomycetota bacterium]
MHADLPNRGIVVAATLALVTGASAEEPNDFFEEATVLAPGVQRVMGDLTPREVGPDTLLGSLDASGAIDQIDDDGSFFGDGFASALSNVPIVNGEVAFNVTGFGDDDFTGDHSESGSYSGTLFVFDSLGTIVNGGLFFSFLEPGVVDEFRLAGPEGGAFEVQLDNVLSDVDFYTFTGLPAGASFAAEAFDPEESGVDTYLGWFDDSGSEIASNDDGGANFLSKLEGVVPASGEITLAVTGFGDFSFEGFHNEDDFPYELLLTIDGQLGGDFNGDGVVNAADYTVWRDGLGDDYTVADYQTWRANFGLMFGGSFPLPAIGAPEPTTGFGLAVAGAVVSGARRRRNAAAIGRS